MRTSEEMADEVWRRVDAVERYGQVKKSKIYSIAIMAACLAVVIGLSIAVPSVPAEDTAAMEMGGAATLFSGGAAGGYVLTGVIAFMLGVFAALFCVKMQRRK